MQPKKCMYVCMYLRTTSNVCIYVWNHMRTCVCEVNNVTWLPHKIARMLEFIQTRSIVMTRNITYHGHQQKQMQHSSMEASISPYTQPANRADRLLHCNYPIVPIGRWSQAECCRDSNPRTPMLECCICFGWWP